MLSPEESQSILDGDFRFNLAEIVWIRQSDGSVNETLGDLTVMDQKQFEGWIVRLRLARALIHNIAL